MKRKKVKRNQFAEQTEPKKKSKYALKGAERRNKKTIIIKSTGKPVYVDKAYKE